MSSKKVTHSLVAMSSAAVLAVYATGYVRTKPAAERFAQQALERTLARQSPPNEASPDANVPASTPSIPATASTAAVPAHSAPKKSIKTENPIPVSSVVAPSPVETPAQVVVPETFVAPPQAEVPATPPPAEAAPVVLKDGKYSGWGGSRHGDIQATVVIEGGRIVSAEISDCQTRYPCDIIEKLPPQVIKRQSYKVDRVGGATESADAFYYAVLEALKLAR